MKKLWILVAVTLGLWLLAACTFYPVVSQVEFEARQTAQAEVVLPTVTPEPPMVTVVPITPTVEPAVVPSTPVPECVVKGNITASGEKIYHVKGQANYNTVKPEDCFPDEDSAVAAGYRKALR